MKHVAIIGGGPGGSTLGAYLSKAGIRNTIFEAATHPRFHVGESLVPTIIPIFEEIGFLPTMESAGFARKYGASWHPPNRRKSITVEIREFQNGASQQDYTYHVERARFDQLLFEHAASLGSETRQGCPVKEVLMDGERARGVRVEIDGEVRDIEADIVVDASGRRALLGRQLGLLRKDPNFDQFAVHAWFEGVDRSAGGRVHDIHIYFLPIERGWAWQIPISDTITSIGIVVDRQVFRAMKGNVEEWFHAMVARSPDFARAMANARRIESFKREGDYTYNMARFSGPGYLMIGDAARFVDPIFSSGVSVALYSARFASQAICDHLLRDQPLKVAFQGYERRLQGACDIWYEFICLYYRLMPLFTLFIQQEETRSELLQLLQGDVYDRDEVPVLDKIREFIEAVEANESHLLHPYLGTIGTDPCTIESRKRTK